jgi:signal transduction histidine kinase
MRQAGVGVAPTPAPTTASRPHAMDPRFERSVVALAQERAALRRIAALVADGVPAAQLYDAVAAEAGALLGADLAELARCLDDGRAETVAMWSANGDEPGMPARRPVAPPESPGSIVVTGGDANAVRSLVGSPIVADGRVWGALVVHSSGGALSPDADARLAGFTELVAGAIGHADRPAALARARARLVEVADAERKRVVADLHDGAQQRLVHTIATLKRAVRALRDGEDPAELVAEALSQANAAMEELRALAHGIMPAVLTRGGLRAGVASLVDQMAIPVAADVAEGRFAAPVEATAYFVVAEALTNVVKHARATRAVVVVGVEDDTLRVEVHDDGIGGAVAAGHGLAGLADRVSALGGRLTVRSRSAGGTLVRATIPGPLRRTPAAPRKTVKACDAASAAAP